MTTFDERETSFENKFKHDQEIEFKVKARRDKLIGLWAAGQLGIHGAEAEAYARSVVAVDLERPGDHDMIEKLLNDFKARNIDISEGRLRRQISELHSTAAAQVKAEA